jgi:O-antigen ligase
MEAAGAIVAAAGVAALLAPVWRERRYLYLRAGALVLVMGAWIGLTVGLLPSATRDSLADRLASPLGVVGAVLATAVGAGLLWLLAEAVRRRPWLWFVALALALPIRLPVEVGDESAKLLVPLYGVIVVGIAAVGLMAWRDERLMLRSPAPLVDVTLAAMAGFLILSEAWTVDHTEGATKLVFFYIPFALLYLLVVALWPRAASLRILGVTTLLAAVPIALLALWQYGSRELLWNDTLIQANVYSRFFRVNSIFFDPNVLGRYLVVAMIAGLAMAWVARDERTLAALGGIGVILFAGLFVTFSRSSALMLMVAVAMIAWRAFGARRTLLVGGALVIAIGALALGTSDQIRRAATSADRLEEVSEGRFDLVRGGVDIWREHPVEGAGLGSFAELYREQLSERDQVRTRVVISHNAPVTVLAEAGVVGFGLLFGLLAAVGVTIAARSRDGTTGGWFEWVILAVLVGIFIHTLLYSALFEDPYVWVLVAAALAGSALRIAARTTPARAST